MFCKEYLEQCEIHTFCQLKAAVTIKEVPKEKLNPVKKKSQQQPSKEEVRKSMVRLYFYSVEGNLLEIYTRLFYWSVSQLISKGRILDPS